MKVTIEFHIRPSQTEAQLTVDANGRHAACRFQDLTPTLQRMGVKEQDAQWYIDTAVYGYVRELAQHPQVQAITPN